MAQAAVIDKCDLCESEENVDYFCVNCDEILCSNCKLIHSKNKKLRNDKIISLSQARRDNIVHKSTTVFCSEHSTVEITLFCLKCDDLICTQCLAGKHKGHGVTLVDELRDSKTGELNKIIRNLNRSFPKYLTKKSTVSVSSFVIRPIGTISTIACGPGDVKITHLPISLTIVSLLTDVSHKPGVSATINLFPSLFSAAPISDLEVTDVPLAFDLNILSPRMVLAVELFPQPVLPIRTSLLSFSITPLLFTMFRSVKFV